jgi:hypothetical protein
LKDGKKRSIVATKANKGNVRLLFAGPLSCAPQAGAVLACQRWGLDFYMETARETTSPAFTPAFAVQECTTVSSKKGAGAGGPEPEITWQSDANVSLGSDKITVSFGYQTGSGIPAVHREIEVTIYNIFAAEGVLKKGTVLKRPESPPGKQVKDNGARDAFEKLQDYNMVTVHA